MRRRRRNYPHILWLVLFCVMLTGCADPNILDNIPRDFALSWGMTEEDSEEDKGEPSSEASSEEAEIPAVCFLMEEAGSFAHDSLSEAEQLWYHDMERILGSYGEEEELNTEGFDAGLDEADVDRIFQCVLSDHPELFYVEGYSYTKYTRGDRLTSIEFSGTYNMDVDTAAVRSEEILAAAEQILAGIDGNAGEYEKVKYVYDTIIRNTDYDMNAPDNQNIYSVFIHHASVCQGYAKAAQYLLNRLGVECTLVLGLVETGEGHAWNLVKVDGEYYYMDATWGDVSYQMEDTRPGEDVHNAMPEINYDYLNVTTEELLRTHSISDEIPMPVCTAVAANYYVREGALFQSYDREQMAALFSGAAERGKQDVTIKCADTACYEEILHALVEGQEIFDYLNDGESRIAYAQNEKQLSLTFWVTNE
ncbi:hypothetical protein NSB25_14345 [Acetatifactor muris]|uniref:Transglutaminase-like superfamily protein n=1 Tax=Acetatifactor muris TaxID=879566 RepID=A0A2K4ZEH9_9FIRM|nr:transglutaminase domain-containing protein [Acetatifactor muris]MCR2048468.1 hypothetical protein [Acetatifactor muris]SOY28854.1 Transglutaminase-like superfamily protein [Acetatifactor muris]